MEYPVNVARTKNSALQIFFKLSKKWQLSVDQERTLLGFPEEDKFTIWKFSKSDSALDDDVLERISHLLNIYKNLCSLLPSKASADEWINKPNDATLFNGNTALSYMLDGELSSIKEVHDYLDDEILGVHRE